MVLGLLVNTTKEMKTDPILHTHTNFQIYKTVLLAYSHAVHHNWKFLYCFLFTILPVQFQRLPIGLSHFDSSYSVGQRTVLMWVLY